MSKITKIGLPSGGTTGQVLKKKTGTNYDVEWGTGGGGGSGTVTSVATTSPITGGTITTTGTIGITQATTSTDGYLSSTDWNTFNNKQSALTNPVTGTGTTNYLPKFTGASTIGNSTIQDLTTGVLVSPSVSASGAIARGLNHTPSLTAAANNDVLVGLDINPTFTNGAFTGVSNWAIRTGTSGEVLFQGGNGVYVTGNNSGIWGNTTRTRGLYFNSSGDVIVRTNNIDNRLVVSNGGNTLIGTGTDSGFKLDVNGTARIQSSPSVNSDSALYILPTTNNSTASATLYGIRKFSTISTINSSSSYIGFSSANNASSNTAAVSGIESNVKVSAGTTTTARTFISNSAVTGTGTITTHIGYDYVDVFKGGSGVLTRQFGVRINNIVNGSSANVGLLFNDSGSTSVNGTWDIYSQSNNNSYFKGNLLLNTTTDSGYKLDVNGTTRTQGDFTISDTKNIILGTTTGTKIGTATTQKIGFFNATPVVQPGAVTTAQGIADALTSLGLLASSTVAGGESVGSKLYLFNSY